MSRLSKTEIYAIRWLDYQDFSSLEIATELKLNEKQVTKTLEKVAGVNKPGKIKTATEPVAKQKHNLFIMESQNKKNRGVAIMTKEASEKADSSRNETTNKSASRRNADIIYRPKN